MTVDSLPPFAAYLYATIERMARDAGGPVRTSVIAETLAVPRRTVRWYARHLETAGLLARRSPRSGYAPWRMLH